MDRTIVIPAASRRLAGVLRRPDAARGVVLFAHGSGSGQASPRNRFVSDRLVKAGLAAVLVDLLTPEESDVPRVVFDVERLADRLCRAIDWIDAQPVLRELPLALYGASTGAAAALIAASRRPERIASIVSRGGRPDLAVAVLDLVRAPTLLVVGSADGVVLELNRRALARLRCPKELAVIAGATHLFPEPGALESVAALALDWFDRHLRVERKEPTDVSRS
jgi:putative phosphoribosyl transferase